MTSRKKHEHCSETAQLTEVFTAATSRTKHTTFGCLRNFGKRHKTTGVEEASVQAEGFCLAMPTSQTLLKVLLSEHPNKMQDVTFVMDKATSTNQLKPPLFNVVPNPTMHHRLKKAAYTAPVPVSDSGYFTHAKGAFRIIFNSVLSFFFPVTHLDLFPLNGLFYYSMLYGI